MKRYPLMDKPTPAEIAALGLEKITGPFGYSMSVREVQAERTGETRPPRAGEWYLSGAVVEAHRAHGDMFSSFPIARLVLTSESAQKLTGWRKTAWEAGWRPVLKGAE